MKPHARAPNGLSERRSTRLEESAYLAGAFFVTICVREMRRLFGYVVPSEPPTVQLSPLGLVVQDEWLRSAEIRRELMLDVFIIMPNHLHGIVWIHEARNATGPQQLPGISGGAHCHAPLQPSFRRHPRSLGAFVAAFKAAVSRHGGQQGPVWQRNYFERIIRNDIELDAMRKYIRTNPCRWILHR